MIFITTQKCNTCYYMHQVKDNNGKFVPVCRCPEDCESYNQYLSVCEACKYGCKRRDNMCEALCGECIMEDR